MRLTIKTKLAASFGVILALFGGAGYFSITAPSRFSTTACDCATTPIRQPCSVIKRVITAAAVCVLPVPGGPCTAR